MLNNDYMLNNREMLYTGATRAKNNLIVITNSLLLTMGINTTNQKNINGKNGKQARYTTLCEFLSFDYKQLSLIEDKHLFFHTSDGSGNKVSLVSFDD